MAAPETIERLQESASEAFALLAGMQLEVFTHLADGPRKAVELARSLGVAEERLTRLLYALVISGLLERRGETFANGPEAATFLVKGLPPIHRWGA
ncbi:MAG TPA: methyltransferase dimerization domain-containing protein [Roseiarcus sp.]|nr:methyltransferase dimerization domain-containing protein [Roseiarcus sp.]